MSVAFTDIIRYSTRCFHTLKIVNVAKWLIYFVLTYSGQDLLHIQTQLKKVVIEWFSQQCKNRYNVPNVLHIPIEVMAVTMVAVVTVFLRKCL